MRIIYCRVFYPKPLKGFFIKQLFEMEIDTGGPL